MNLNIIKLERLPSLLLIWTQWNEHASEKEIKRLMDLISDTIDLDELYLAEKADENESSVRHLISMSATNGEGHIVFKTVGEGEWVALSKDANIERLDSWDEVTKSCCSKGLIPNVFLYEEVEVLVSSIARGDILLFNRKSSAFIHFYIFLLFLRSSGATKLAFNSLFSNSSGCGRRRTRSWWARRDPAGSSRKPRRTRSDQCGVGEGDDLVFKQEVQEFSD